MNRTDNYTDIAVIGGGAAGMMAALSARFSEAGKDLTITIFERNERVGKKLLMTGNGRCNLTNTDCADEHFHGRDPRFSGEAIRRFGPPDVIRFFEDLGVLVKLEEDHKVYPESLHAASVLDALRLALDEQGIKVLSNAFVQSIAKNGGLFCLQLSDGVSYSAGAVIAATGGMCAPATGSDGFGYSLLKSFSHTLCTPLPSIVQIKTDTAFCKPLQGNKVFGNARLEIDNRTIREEYGEILFTEYGLSGPPILQLSGYVARAFASKPKSVIHIYLDFLPKNTLEETVDLLKWSAASFPDRNLEDFLAGMFHKRLALGLMKKAADKPMSGKVNQLSDREIRNLADACKSLRIAVTGTMPFANAQTTSGGISTTDFDPLTMESRKCSGLYACGEVLDIDGDCGGYNLQWAWSSGHLAGESAAQYILKRD
jgi:predicted Rossmann fold flavoprotein